MIIYRVQHAETGTIPLPERWDGILDLLEKES